MSEISVKDESIVIEDGHGKGCYVRYNFEFEAIDKTIVPEEKPDFDIKKFLLEIHLLSNSEYEHSNSTMQSYEEKTFTPSLMDFGQKKTSRGLVHTFRTDCFRGERLYMLLNRLTKEGNESFSSIVDESASRLRYEEFSPDDMINFEKEYTVSELLELRRLSSVGFNNYLVKWFNEPTEIDGETMNPLMHLIAERVSDAKRNSRVGKEEFLSKIYSYELISNLNNLKNNYSVSLSDAFKLKNNFHELSDLILFDLNEPNEYHNILHDDNNKNVIIMQDTFGKLTFGLIDFDELAAGHQAENWFRQIIYPGQYTTTNHLKIETSEKKLQEIANINTENLLTQLNGYFELKGITEIDKKLESLAIMSAVGLRDSAYFHSINNLVLKKGFFQMSIDMINLLYNHGAVPNLKTQLDSAYKKIFNEEYVMIDHKLK